MRDRRLQNYHEFGARQGWPVLGLHQDLSTRYPVEPLLGVASAQAELALTGPWQDWSALIASVLVRSGADTTGAHPHLDTVVQLTVLDTGPLPLQFTAVCGVPEPDVALLSGDGARHLPRLVQHLCAAVDRGYLEVGDHVAANGVELLHTRLAPDVRHAGLDLAGPLAALVALALELTGRRTGASVQ